MNTLKYTLGLSLVLFIAACKNSNRVSTIKESPRFYRIVKLYDNKLSVSIPTTFTIMSRDLVDSKYPNRATGPQIVYTDSTASINIAFSQTRQQGEESDLPEVKNHMTQQIQAIALEGFNSRIEKINGHIYVVFEFTSQAIDTRIYNLLFVTNLDHKILMGTFNCTKELEKEWKPRAKEILASLRK